MAPRRPGSIGSGSTGSTSRSLDPKAQRDVDALLGISRRDPPRDKHREKSKEKVRDLQPSEQPREHGRGILGGSLFKRSTKKDKSREPTSTPSLHSEPHTRNVLHRHHGPPMSNSPPLPPSQSGSSIPLPPSANVSARSIPLYPQHPYQPQQHPAVEPHRDVYGVAGVARSRTPGRNSNDSSKSDISLRRALAEHPAVDDPGQQHRLQEIPRKPVEPRSEPHIRRSHRPQDLDLSRDQPLPHARHPATLYPQMSPYADDRSSRGTSDELQRQHTQSSTSMASYPETPDSIGRVRRSHEISPRYQNRSPKYSPSAPSNGISPSHIPREQPPSASVPERVNPPRLREQPPAPPAPVPEPESEDDEQGDVLSFAQATAGLGPDIGFNAPQPLTVSYPTDEPFKPLPQRILPFRPAPTTLDTLTPVTPIAGQPSPHNVSPIQRPVSQVSSPVPEMWLGGGAGGAGTLPPSRQVSTRRLSFISVLEDGPPPPGDDEELPDYAASQAQAQAAGRAEAARRARELQRRWQQGSQMRGGT